MKGDYGWKEFFFLKAFKLYLSFFILGEMPNYFYEL